MPSSLIPLRPDELDTRTPVSTDWVIITPTGGPAYKCAVSSIGGGGGGSAPTVNAQTGTTYTLALTDANNRVTLSNTSGITVTIPPNSSVNFPVGTGIDLIQANTGQVTVVGGSGVTLNSAIGYKIRTLAAGCSLIQIAANSWIMVGDITT
jgi:hypothetical protein